MKTSRFTFVISALLLTLVLTGCGPVPVRNVDNSQLSNAADADLAQVSRAIITAGAGLGWQMQKISDGHIVGTLTLRAHVAKVDITFDTKTFSINYKDSSNLEYKDNKIHNNYNGWVQNLANAIVVQTSAL